MFSTGRWWVIFTLCVIVLIQWLVVSRLVDAVISMEVVSMTLPLGAVQSIIEQNDLKVPGVLLQRFQAHPNDPLTANDVKYFDFRTKWIIITSRDSAKAVCYVVGLAIAGLLAAFLIASVTFRHLMSFTERMHKMSSTDKIALFLGLLVGIILCAIILPLLAPLIGGNRNPFITGVAGLVVVYLCVIGTMSMKQELKYYFPSLAKTTEFERAFQKPKVLDTNVIIDGRVADICRTGFLEGRIVVPSFVVDELQHIADGSDNLKRARGRRGLDVLKQLQNEFGLTIRECRPSDPENAEEVDALLVNLAQEIDAAIVTNDFNLNQAATLRGVTVLNINELANALKPVVLPGEVMAVTIVKQGKEANQGIGYLDDGTMVVVENGKGRIGQNVEVVVTSVLQTVAGKMIFTNLKEDQDKEDDLIERNVRSYSSSRPRKKTQ